MEGSARKEYGIILVILTIFVIGFTRLANGQSPEKINCPSAIDLKNQKISYRIIPVHNGTWGYVILVDNKVVIHQPIIPCVKGNDGFTTKQDARKVAALVLAKLKKGEMRPGISVKEMEKLKVL